MKDFTALLNCKKISFQTKKKVLKEQLQKMQKYNFWQKKKIIIIYSMTTRRYKSRCDFFHDLAKLVIKRVIKVNFF